MQAVTRLALALTVFTLSLAQLAAQVAQPPPGQKGQIQNLQGQPKPTYVTEIAGKTLQQWIKEISANDPSTRENAIRTIPLFGPAAVEAVPALIERINRDRDTSPRVNAIMALGAIDGISREEIEKIVSALAARVTEDRQDIVRYHAALVLGRFGWDSRSAVPKLITASKDVGSWEVRKAAIFALGRAYRDPKQPINPTALQALTYPLTSGYEPSSQVRLEAVMALGSVGPPADAKEKAILDQALRQAMRDSDRLVQIWGRVVYMAYINNVKEDDLAFLSKNLKSPELPVRVHSARALGMLQAHAKSRVPDLVQMLSDKEPLAQLAAIQALASIGEAAQAAVGPLTEMMGRKEMQPEDKDLIRHAINAITGKPRK